MRVKIYACFLWRSCSFTPQTVFRCSFFFLHISWRRNSSVTIWWNHPIKSNVRHNLWDKKTNRKSRSHFCCFIHRFFFQAPVNFCATANKAFWMLIFFLYWCYRKHIRIKIIWSMSCFSSMTKWVSQQGLNLRVSKTIMIQFWNILSISLVLLPKKLNISYLCVTIYLYCTTNENRFWPGRLEIIYYWQSFPWIIDPGRVLVGLWGEKLEHYVTNVITKSAKA